MQFHTIVSAFYLDRTKVDGDLATLLHRVGVVDIAPLKHRLALGFDDPKRLVLGGKWSVFGDTWAVLDEVDGLVCLQLYSSFNRFFRNPSRQDEYVAAFAAACSTLLPPAALLDARAHNEIRQWQEQEGNRDWVLAQAHRVAAGDVNALADERVSLLYLSWPLVAKWDSTPARDHREVTELPTGQLCFADYGSARLA